MPDDKPRESGRKSLADSGIETACYLCYAQCVNPGSHGDGVRPCARNLVAVVSREERLRRRSRRQSE